VLADLIASTQDAPEGIAVVAQGPSATAPVQSTASPEGEFVRDFIAQQDAERLAHDELDTVNFQRLDDDTDWTEV
jgi:hypothetical protein